MEKKTLEDGSIMFIGTRKEWAEQMIQERIEPARKNQSILLHGGKELADKEGLSGNVVKIHSTPEPKTSD